MYRFASDPTLKVLAETVNRIAVETETGPGFISTRVDQKKVTRILDRWFAYAAKAKVHHSKLTLGSVQEVWTDRWKLPVVIVDTHRKNKTWEPWAGSGDILIDVEYDIRKGAYYVVLSDKNEHFIIRSDQSPGVIPVEAVWTIIVGNYKLLTKFDTMNINRAFL